MGFELLSALSALAIGLAWLGQVTLLRAPEIPTGGAQAAGQSDLQVKGTGDGPDTQVGEFLQDPIRVQRAGETGGSLQGAPGSSRIQPGTDETGPNRRGGLQQ